MYRAIETTKGLKVACNQCNTFYPATEIVEAHWKKKNLSLWLCIRHFNEFYKMTTDDAEIGKEQIAQAGLLEQGFKEKDVKHYLKKWAKNKIDQSK